METTLVDACEEFVDGVASRDVRLGEHLWSRIFLPQDRPLEHHPMPVVLYTHGGAYSFGQPHWSCFHTFCSTACRLSRSIWVSLAYRLAPAHRLPAAYDDALLALRWLSAQALQQRTSSSDPWLSSHLADFSNVLLAGESAGANIALKTAMDTAASSADLQPLRITGLLLLQPGFHSEAKRGTVLDEATEARYNGALPVGETLDYAPVNPMHHAAPPLTPLSAYPHIFINAASADFRFDMVIRFYNIVRELCPHVELLISPGEDHAFHLDHPHRQEGHRLLAELASFIHRCTTSAA